MRLVVNPKSQRRPALDPKLTAALGVNGPEAVLSLLAHCPRHVPTPLHELPALGAELGIGRLFLKDESLRLGVNSFKGLGGASAVARLVADRAAQALGRPPAPEELVSDAVRAVARDMTVACATDGNHGRSVAAGAQVFGCRCVIFLHAGVSAGREAAIRGFGAEIVRVTGDYDDSVEEAAARADDEGWDLVSDTSRPGYEETPLAVMQGYTVMAKEALDQMAARGTAPSHVFVQGGVGGLAAAVFAYAVDRLGGARPTLVVAEPEAANCLLQSAEQGRCVSIGAHPETVMGMLECGEPSYVAWQVLERTADAFLDLPDAAAVEAMRRLAEPGPGDPAVVCGESGAAGLAGLMAAARDGEWREAVGLGSESVALVFGTEGATDPEIYQRLTGQAPQDVRARQADGGAAAVP